MILEDVHWIDPTSLEVFNRVVDRIKTLPVLLIVTFRPEFNAPVQGRATAGLDGPPQSQAEISFRIEADIL
jgi:predicted ATPase